MMSKRCREITMVPSVITKKVNILDDEDSFEDPVAIAFFISTTSSSCTTGPRLFGRSGGADITEELQSLNFGASGSFRWQ